MENVYATAKGVAQVYVHGSSLETACVAIVVPDIPVLLEILQDKGISPTEDIEAMLSSKVQCFRLLAIFSLLSVAFIGLF